jgi:hypothetical protein
VATHGHGVRVWAGPFFGNLLIGLLLLGAGWFGADAGSSIAILGPLTAQRLRRMCSLRDSVSWRLLQSSPLPTTRALRGRSSHL